MDNVDLTDPKQVRLRALEIAAEGRGKIRYDPAQVVADAAVFAEYIGNATVPPVTPVTPPSTRGPGRPRRGSE